MHGQKDIKCRVLYLQDKRDVKLTTHFHLLPRLRMGGLYFYSPLYMFKARTGTALLLLTLLHLILFQFVLSVKQPFKGPSVHTG